MPAETSRGVHNVLIFRAAGQRCAIAAERVAELVLIPALLRLPAQPTVLDGFLNLRGAAVPVVALDRLFGAGAFAPGLHTPLIVLATSEGPLALRVQSVDDVATVADDALLPAAPDNSLNGCAESQFEWQGEGVAILSPEHLLLQKEQSCIADLREQAERRIRNLGAPVE